MIVELTLLTDDGKPFILTNANCSIFLQDLNSETEIRLNANIVANKLVYHVPTAETEERFYAN